MFTFLPESSGLSEKSRTKPSSPPTTVSPCLMPDTNTAESETLLSIALSSSMTKLSVVLKVTTSKAPVLRFILPKAPSKERTQHTKSLYVYDFSCLAHVKLVEPFGSADIVVFDVSRDIPHCAQAHDSKL